MAPLLLLLLATLPQSLGGSGLFAQPRLWRWGAAILQHLLEAPCIPWGGPQPKCPSHKIRAYIGGLAPDGYEKGDMVAFRFGAFNPILDPWIFILFRKAVFRSLHTLLCWPWVGRRSPEPRRLDSVPFQSNFSC